MSIGLRLRDKGLWTCRNVVWLDRVGLQGNESNGGSTRSRKEGRANE